MATGSPRITAPLCLATKREKERERRLGGGGGMQPGKDAPPGKHVETQQHGCPSSTRGTATRAENKN